VYLATDGTGREFEQFLVDHARLLAWLPAWTIVAVGSSAVALARCEGVFERTRQRFVQPESVDVEALGWLCITQQRIDRDDLADLSLAAIDRYRTLRAQCAGTFDALYAEWCQQGEAALASYVANPADPQSAAKTVAQSPSR
jgi:hypothetical protein